MSATKKEINELLRFNVRDYNVKKTDRHRVVIAEIQTIKDTERKKMEKRLKESSEYKILQKEEERLGRQRKGKIERIRAKRNELRKQLLLDGPSKSLTKKVYELRERYIKLTE